MRSLRNHVRSVSVCFPEMWSNTLSCATNSDWNSSGFMSGGEGMSSTSNQMRSCKDRVYHKTMGHNLTGIMKRNSCW